MEENNASQLEGGCMIHSNYQKKENKEKVKQLFFSNPELPSITLYDFFDWKFYEDVEKKLTKMTFSHSRSALHHRYSCANPPLLLKKFLNSDEFISYLSTALNKEFALLQGKMYKFSWKDYTLLHDPSVEEEGYDLVMDFTEDWNQEAGGQIIYVDGEGDYRSVPVAPNAITITLRKPGIHKFVKYINNKAGKNQRICLLGSIE